MLSDPEKETFKTFSNPFIEALKKVFSSMVFAEITPQSPLLNKNIEKNDISVAMGLNGVVKLAGEEKPFKGMLVLSFSTPVYLKISSSMLMNEYKEYSEEIRDVGAEITNIVTGNAKRYLREMGYLIEMSIDLPPRFVPFFKRPFQAFCSTHS